MADAKISVLDRGFIYGDGVYEVVPVYGRRPFRMPHHLARLQYSLDGIRLANPHAECAVGGADRRPDRAPAVRRPGASTCRSRAASPSATTRFPKGVAPTVFMMSNPLVAADARAGRARRRRRHRRRTIAGCAAT